MDSKGSFPAVAIVLHLILPTRPHSIGSLSQSELVNSLSEPIDEAWRQDDVHLDEFLHEDECLPLSTQISVVLVSHISKGKAEGVHLVCETNLIES